VTLRQVSDLVLLRQRLRATLSSADAFTLTRILTVASELGRNCVVHGGGGHCDIEPDAPLAGHLRLRFVDTGPGIEDVEAALIDGYSTTGSLGLGLGGARRLSDAFDLHTASGRGTRVTVVLACSA